ncbi:MAG: chromate transporter [Dorea sp.]
MVYLNLFLSFIKIGFTSFGGMSMIPLILEEMQTHHWMTAEDLTNLVAIAEMTPGPLGINCATFAGTQTAGILGGIAAVLGVLMPAFTLTLVVAVFFTKVQKSSVMAGIMGYVKPICIAMILGVMLTLGQENYFIDGNLDWGAVGIGVLMVYLIQKRKWSVPKVIGSSAVLGILFHMF